MKLKNISKAFAMVLIGTAFNTFAAVNEDKDSCSFSDATSSSAIEFVNDYYDHMKRGMNQKQLSYYWSSKKSTMLDKTIANMALSLRHDYATESQRFLDSMHAEAICEDLSLSNTKGYGYHHPFVELTYERTPRCTEWSNTKGRTLKLKYLKSSCRWLIDDIKEEVYIK